jgi:NAD(P)-dependent dehydrogenase (short-subunit alcohol dehydrogenase family)
MLDIQGGLSVVTGAGSGIGKATAEALAAEGARLVVCDVDPVGLARVAAALGAACVQSTVLDVGDRAAYSTFASALLARHGPPRVLVNNAGVGLAGGMLDTPLDDWDWLLRINLMGVVHGCHFFAPAMAAARLGQVVNVASMLGLVATPNTAAYCTSKFGVVGLSEALRAELAPLGVGVSTICPGMVRTAIIGKARFRGPGDGEARRAAVEARYVKRDYGPERVAQAIVEAIRHDRGLVPVTPESRVAWYLKRVAPGFVPTAARWLEQQFGESK